MASEFCYIELTELQEGHSICLDCEVEPRRAQDFANYWLQRGNASEVAADDLRVPISHNKIIIEKAENAAQQD